MTKKTDRVRFNYAARLTDVESYLKKNHLALRVSKYRGTRRWCAALQVISKSSPGGGIVIAVGYGKTIISALDDAAWEYEKGKRN